MHRAAVHGTASRDYAADTLAQWAPMPISVAAISRFKANPEKELRFVAEIDDVIVGSAAIVPKKEELRACYVSPEVAGRGVGRALIAELERTARRIGLARLQLDSSLTAHPFYASLGYQAISQGTHILGSGARMACIHMRKDLPPLP